MIRCTGPTGIAAGGAISPRAGPGTGAPAAPGVTTIGTARAAGVPAIRTAGGVASAAVAVAAPPVGPTPGARPAVAVPGGPTRLPITACRSPVGRAPGAVGTRTALRTAAGGVAPVAGVLVPWAITVTRAVSPTVVAPRASPSGAVPSGTLMSRSIARCRRPGTGAVGPIGRPATGPSRAGAAAGARSATPVRPFRPITVPGRRSGPAFPVVVAIVPSRAVVPGTIRVTHLQRVSVLRGAPSRRGRVMASSSAPRPRCACHGAPPATLPAGDHPPRAPTARRAPWRCSRTPRPR